MLCKVEAKSNRQNHPNPLWQTLYQKESHLGKKLLYYFLLKIEVNKFWCKTNFLPYTHFALRVELTIIDKMEFPFPSLDFPEAEQYTRGGRNTTKCKNTVFRDLLYT